jgi:hypothetical protein
MERVKGIEPSSDGWEPSALPLSYTRPDWEPIGAVRIPEGGMVQTPLVFGQSRTL